MLNFQMKVTVNKKIFPTSANAFLIKRSRLSDKGREFQSCFSVDCQAVACFMYHYAKGALVFQSNV